MAPPYPREGGGMRKRMMPRDEGQSRSAPSGDKSFPTQQWPSVTPRACRIIRITIRQQRRVEVSVYVAVGVVWWGVLGGGVRCVEAPRSLRGGGGADLHAAYVTDASRSCQTSSGFSGMMPPCSWQRCVFFRMSWARGGGGGGLGGIGRDLTLPSVGVKG